MLYKNIIIPIYGGRLHIAVVEDFVLSLLKLNKTFNQTFTEEDAVLGMSQQRGGHTLIIINVGKHKKVFKKSFEIELIGTITHEAVHACNQIFGIKGLRLDSNNDESQSYFTEYIVKEIYKLYTKHKEIENLKEKI